MIKKLLPAVFALLFASHAGAVTLDGVTLPDTYMVDGKAIPLNGIGLRTLSIFSVKVYVAALYVAQPSHSADAILSSPEDKVLVLHFLHAGSKADVEKEYRAGETTNCSGGGCDPADAADFERLVASAPAVAVGDTTTYVFTPKEMRVLANNRQIGEYNNKDLARLILSGFIGAHPPSADLRSALLGQH